MVSEKYIADRIKTLRKNAGLDVNAVGEGVGRSGKTISAWETGRNTPSAEMLISICRFFDVGIDYFYPPDVTEGRTCLTEHEQELLEIMRSITLEGQKQLLIYARGVAASYPKADSVRKLA